MSARLVLVVALAGCTGAIGDAATTTVDGNPTPTADAPAATPGEGAVARARTWVAAQLHYCQAPNHHPDPDADCASTCNRQDDPAWDPYRSDCSGLVSWAWALPAPGRTTGDFAPFTTDLTHAIAVDALRPGDAVNNDHHVMLFVAWADAAHTRATFIDEPGCASAHPYAEEFTTTVTPSGASDPNALAVKGYGSYTAIRYDDAP